MTRLQNRAKIQMSIRNNRAYKYNPKLDMLFLKAYFSKEPGKKFKFDFPAGFLRKIRLYNLPFTAVKTGR